MPPDLTHASYDRVMQVLAEGTAEDLEALAREDPGFPEGVDAFIGRRWIINAIDCGSKCAVAWMLGKGVELAFKDEEGITPVHAAIERENPDKYEVMELLLRAGAPVNAHGTNDHTPSHLAAAYDDVAALKVLIAHGADLSIRTCIDHFATPLEEARHLGAHEAASFLEQA